MSSGAGTLHGEPLGEIAANDRGGRHLYAARRRALNAQLPPSGLIAFFKRWSTVKDGALENAPRAVTAAVIARNR